MPRVFREYERRKTASGAIDFEDLLELAVRLYEEDEWALAALRERYRAFTVDEYQDVNLLQQSLLELWLGDARRPLRRRRRLPVDLRLHRRVARVAARSGDALSAGDRRPARGELPLQPRRCSGSRTGWCRSSAAPRRRCARRGPRVRSQSCAASTRPRRKDGSCSSACARCAAEGVPYEEMAVLMRLERALGRLRGAASATRRSRSRGRRCFHATGRASCSRGCAVRASARWRRRCVASRWSKGSRIRCRRASASVSSCARPTSHASASSPRSTTTGRTPLRTGSSGCGLASTTGPRAAYICSRSTAPRVSSSRRSSCRGSRRRSCPASRRCASAAVAEERRLLYVGMTRAKRHLALTWAGKPSRFLTELGVEAAAARPAEAARRGAERPDLPGAEALAARAREGRRDSGVRRLPQLDAGRDRRAPAADDRRARLRRRRRPREARALRRRGASRAARADSSSSSMSAGSRRDTLALAVRACAGRARAGR